MVRHDVRNYWQYKKKFLKTKNYLLQQYYTYRARRLLWRNNAFIPFSADINRFVTPHGLNGIMVTRGAKIGKRCVIFHQVTIGSNTLRETKGAGAPTIGNNVYIGTGAKIIGGVTVGNNVRIGANCVVTSDIPANSTVVLSQPRIICHRQPRSNAMLIFENGGRQ